MKITHIKLSFSNAYLIRDEKVILVDTGMPGEDKAILEAARRAGVRPEDISLILHTHAHVDHAGSTAALASQLGVPTAVHRLDEAMLLAGKMNPLVPLRLEARLVLPMVNRPFPPVTPDLYIEEGTDLRPYGVDGKILHTPGHTAGSITVLLPKGDAVAGDVMMGGMMGGNIFYSHPNYHYFADDLQEVRRSIRRLLEAGVKRFFVGHGGPLITERVLERFEKDLGK